MFFALEALVGSVALKNSKRTVFTMVCLRHDAVVLYPFAQLLNTREFSLLARALYKLHADLLSVQLPVKIEYVRLDILVISAYPSSVEVL